MENAQKITKKTGINFEFISIGGGFGIPYNENEKPLNLDRLFQSLSKKYKKKLK